MLTRVDDRLEQALQHRDRRPARRRSSRDLAGVLDLDLLDRARCRAGPGSGRASRRARGTGASAPAARAEIDGTLTALRTTPDEQEVAHLLGDRDRDVDLRLLGRGAEVRRADRPARARPAGGPPAAAPRRRRRARRRRRGRDSSASSSAASSTMPPRAAFTISTPFFIFAKASRAEQAGRVLGQRHVHGDEVGALEQLVELDQLDVELLRPSRARRTDRSAITLHAEALRALGDDAPDVAEADDAERPVVELRALELGLLPLAGLHRGGGLRGCGAPARQQRDARARRW